MKFCSSIIFFLSLMAFGSQELVNNLSISTVQFGQGRADSDSPTHHIKYTATFWMRHTAKDPWTLVTSLPVESDIPSQFEGVTLGVSDSAENTAWTLAIYFPKKIDDLGSLEQRFDVDEQKFKSGSTEPVKTQSVAEMSHVVRQGTKSTYVFTTYLTGKQVKVEISQAWNPIH